MIDKASLEGSWRLQLPTSEGWYDRALSEARVSGAKDCLGKGFSNSGPSGGEGFPGRGTSMTSEDCLRFRSLGDIEKNSN